MTFKRVTVALVVAALVVIVLVVATRRPTENVYNNLQGLTLDEVRAQFGEDDQPRIGIAFGGGGVRGFMHLGVIKALEDAGIRADVVVGTSAGSIAAILYASGTDYADIEAIVSSVKEWDLADPVVSRDGVFNGKKIAAWVNQWSPLEDLSDAPIRLGVTATDVAQEAAVLFVAGSPGEAAQASATIPGAFIPVESNGRTYIDGGVLTLVPVRFARALGADTVIAIDIYCGSPATLEGGAVSTMYTTFKLQGCALADRELAEADFVIRPAFETGSVTSFDARDAAFDAGYQAAQPIIEALQQRQH